MPKDLTITVCQTNPDWEDKAANLNKSIQIVSDLKEQTDLIIFPEMFSTGFTMSPEHFAETNQDNTITSLYNTSQNCNTAICGSFVATDNGSTYFNRFFFVSHNGELCFYDKRHLFTMGDEPNHYTAGENNITIPYKGWTLLPLVCYDLRFPGWIRASVPFDILICVANWPKARQDAWITLLKARAIENQCYVIGVNRTGKDGNGLSYSGNSMVFGPKGEVILDLMSETNNKSVILSWKELYDFRQKFPILKDRDNISIL